MPDFSNRYRGRERMDDLQASGTDLHQALQELDVINFLLGGNHVTLNGLTQLLEKRSPATAVHIADLGCGSGDMLRRVRRLLIERGEQANLTGIDANPNVIGHAVAHTPSSCGIVYTKVDIFSEEFKHRKFDIVLATLFFHHFSDDQLIRFFRQLRDQVSGGMVINDIHRHWLSYFSIKFLTRLFSRSAMVRHDAPVSVLRAFTRTELRHLLQEAGIVRYTLKWRWAFRWQLVVWF